MGRSQRRPEGKGRGVSRSKYSPPRIPLRISVLAPLARTLPGAHTRDPTERTLVRTHARASPHARAGGPGLGAVDWLGRKLAGCAVLKCAQQREAYSSIRVGCSSPSRSCSTTTRGVSFGSPERSVGREAVKPSVDTIMTRTKKSLPICGTRKYQC